MVQRGGWQVLEVEAEGKGLAKGCVGRGAAAAAAGSGKWRQRQLGRQGSPIDSPAGIPAASSASPASRLRLAICCCCCCSGARRSTTHVTGRALGRCAACWPAAIGLVVRIKAA